MKSSLKKKDKSTVEIEIEIPTEDFQKYIEKAVSAFQEHLEVEGFRKGKAPVELVKQKVGQDTILAKAAELAISDVYEQVLKEHDIEAVGQPEMQLIKLAEGNPLVCKITAGIVPDITLPDYKAIAVKIEKKEVVIEEKEIENALEWLQKNRKEQGNKTQEFTDEFAKSLGNYENLAALKDNIRKELTREKEIRETQRVKQEVLDNIAKESTISIPAAFLENEKKSMLENLKQGVSQTLKIEFKDYLEKIKKSEQELLDSFQQEAEKRVKNYLVLREIAKREQIAISAQEIEEEMQKILRQYANAGEAQKSVDSERLREYTKLVLKNEKTLQSLIQ